MMNMDFQTGPIPDYNKAQARPQWQPRFAIGRNTGTLYFLLRPDHGVVIVPRGDAVRQGFMPGTYHTNTPDMFSLVPEGHRVTIDIRMGA